MFPTLPYILQKKFRTGLKTGCREVSWFNELFKFGNTFILENNDCNEEESGYGEENKGNTVNLHYSLVKGQLLWRERDYCCPSVSSYIFHRLISAVETDCFR
jgi:hypothetical protein